MLRETMLVLCSACSLVTAVPDDSTNPTSNGGAGGAGAASSSLVGGSGGLGAGGMGATGGGGCDADLTSDPEHCGACDWNCGPGVADCVDGICGAYSIEWAAPITGIAVVGEHVVTQVGNVAVDALHTRPVEFDSQAATILSIDSQENGVGFIGRTAALPNERFLYAPQVSPMEGAPTLLSCSLTNESACAQITLIGGPGGAHVNGLTTIDGDLIMTTSAAGSGLLIVGIDACAAGECDVANLSSPIQPASGANPTPIGLEVQQVGAQTTLWWVQLVTSGTGCIHQWRSDFGMIDVPCVLTPVQPFHLAAAGPNVFFEAVGSGEAPIHRVYDPPAGGEQVESAPISNPNLQWPADVDELLLYAFDHTDQAHALVAVRPDSTSENAAEVVEVGRVPLPVGELISSVDASHELYVFFSTSGSSGSSKLYRWRKPAPDSQ